MKAIVGMITARSVAVVIGMPPETGAAEARLSFIGDIKIELTENNQNSCLISGEPAARFLPSSIIQMHALFTLHFPRQTSKVSSFFPRQHANSPLVALSSV